ncbi:MAG: hypothetical protein ACJ76S_07460 [Solirubrobacteraceae bacterium]
MSTSVPQAGPITATGTASRNVDGQAIALTAFSTVKWWGRLWLPVLFWFATHCRKSGGDLGRLSFIHFARWTLVRRLPAGGPDRGSEQLRYARLFFESNFNGGWEEYIDAFSHIVATGMKTFWGSSYGFPKPLPTAPFKRYIKRNEIEVSHFYSAYPEATTTMISASLKLQPQVAAFKQRTQGLEPDAFAAEWQDFVTDVQAHL